MSSTPATALPSQLGRRSRTRWSRCTPCNVSSTRTGCRNRGIEHFDSWAATFGEIVDTMEISPDGAGLRQRSRFAKFTNLPELQQMFRQVSDVQTAEMLNLPRPKLQDGKPIVVACPMSEEQQQLQQELVERYEKLRSQKVDPAH
jgi:N12 class adenine-specific DNA methylase